MTTTVFVAITGNKVVSVECPQGKRQLQPGQHCSFTIHGEQSVSVKEIGGFIMAHIKAQALWAAYSAEAGGQTFDGKPLPTWEELGEDRQRCWVRVAREA
jgi:hypothetical protein